MLKEDLGIEYTVEEMEYRLETGIQIGDIVCCDGTPEGDTPCCHN